MNEKHNSENVSITKRDIEVFKLIIRKGGFATPRQIAGSGLFRNEKKARERLYLLYCCGYLGRFRRKRW